MKDNMENNINNANKIYLCAICNIESGTCDQDCKFCTQSVKYQADIARYKRKDIDMIVAEAKNARKNKAIGFCLVTAGKGLTNKRLAYICEAVRAVKKENLGLKPDIFFFTIQDEAASLNIDMQFLSFALKNFV